MGPDWKRRWLTTALMLFNLVVATAWGTSTPTPSPAATPASSPGVISFTGGTAVVGVNGSYGLTTNRNLKITAVGVWDEGGSGLPEDVVVSIYETPGGAFARTTYIPIPSGTSAPLVNGFRYVPFSKDMPAGYEVFMGSSNSIPVITNPSSITIAPEVTLFNGDPNPAWFGPNFQFTTALLFNDDFEQGPFNTNGNVNGWSAWRLDREPASIADVPKGAGSTAHAVVFNRAGDSEGNILQQDFFGQSNRRYNLDFDAAVYGQRSGAPLQLNVQVNYGLNGQVFLNATVTPPDAFTFNFNAVVFQHYHFEFVAPGQAILQFTDVGLGNAAAETYLDNVSLAPAPLPYSAWQSLYFTQSQRNDLSVSGWTADPDRDGIPNGLEFYFNTNPIAGMSQADAAALPQLTVLTGSYAGDVSLTYRRRIGAGGTIVGSFSPGSLPPQQSSGGANPSLPSANKQKSRSGASSIATADNETETVTELRSTYYHFYRLTVGIEHPSSASQWSAAAGGNDHWYEVITSTATWQQARDYAVDRGGYLATISSAEENDFIKSLIPEGANPFIGGYKDNAGWHWVTAEPFSFTSWDPGQPDGFGADVIQFLRSTGTWNDALSTDSNTFVVEYPE